MEKSIKHQWFLPHPPQTVWHYLTDSDLLSQWLMENDFQLVAGRKFMFKTKARKFGFDGKIYCEVLDFEEFKRLSYSWRGGPGEGKVSLDSVVTWTLIPRGNGTELILEHAGFKGLTNFIAYLVMNKGWLKIVKRLAKKIDRQYETARS